MNECRRHIEIRTLTAMLFISLSLLLFFKQVGAADISEPDNWQQIHTKNTMICFQSMDDLRRLNAGINYDPDCHKNEKAVDPNLSPNLADTIAKKIDTLFARSQEILEMQGFINKISVKIFNDKQQFNHAFFTLYKKECTERAWYTHEKLTVYIQLDDFHEGMLAHEFAHAIINQYMIVPLPGKTAEILARYVDTHLHADETKIRDDSYINAYSN